MAFRQEYIDGVGEVNVYKRRGAKQVRLSIASTGKVRVTIPYWAPYGVGIDFVKRRIDWINEQLPDKVLLTDHMRIGKAHRLVFAPSDGVKVRTKISENQVIVKMPQNDLSYDSPINQQAASKAAVRVLKKEATALLTQRLNSLASKYGFRYTKLEIKQLKSRWGSCNSKQEIVLNCFLMQLPWKYIDYVLLHELTHTEHMSHNGGFWAKLESVYPESKRARKELQAYRPILTIVE